MATTLPSGVPWKTRSPPVDRVWLISAVRFDHSQTTLFFKRPEDTGLFGLAEVLAGDAGEALALLIGQIGHIGVPHAELVRRDVEIPGLRVVDLRLPARRAEQGRTDLHRRPAHRGSQAGILDALAGGGIGSAPGERLYERRRG